MISTKVITTTKIAAGNPSEIDTQNSGLETVQLIMQIFMIVAALMTTFCMRRWLRRQLLVCENTS